MKRLLAYLFIVLGLLWCNVGFAEKINLYCSGKVDRGNKIEPFFEEFEIGTYGSDIPYVRIINQSHGMGRNSLWERNMEKKILGPSKFKDLRYEFDQKDKTLYMSSKYKYKTTKGSVWDVSVKETITLHNGIFSMRVVFGVTGKWEEIWKFRGDCDTSALLASLKKDEKDEDEEISDYAQLETLNPLKIKSDKFDNKIALIIGIEKYSDAPNAQFANSDAKKFLSYARNAFGIKKQNINILIDNKATNAQIQKSLQIWLKSKVKSGKSDLIIFFSGHGLASLESKELYLVPHDGIPDVLESTSLSRTKLYKRISDLKPKSVTIFLDTCYSGVTRDKKMLLEGSRPLMIVPSQNQNNIPDNFTVFSASQLDQISSGLKEANHGIFSYYLMKGLEGNADSNQDNKITNGELLAYMDENVSQKAAEQGRQQNPSLAGDLNKVLISYR